MNILLQRCANYSGNKYRAYEDIYLLYFFVKYQDRPVTRSEHQIIKAHYNRIAAYVSDEHQFTLDHQRYLHTIFPQVIDNDHPNITTSMTMHDLLDNMIVAAPMRPRIPVTITIGRPNISIFRKLYNMFRANNIYSSL